MGKRNNRIRILPLFLAVILALQSVPANAAGNYSNYRTENTMANREPGLMENVQASDSADSVVEVSGEELSGRDSDASDREGNVSDKEGNTSDQDASQPDSEGNESDQDASQPDSEGNVSDKEGNTSDQDASQSDSEDDASDQEDNESDQNTDVSDSDTDVSDSDIDVSDSDTDVSDSDVAVPEEDISADDVSATDVSSNDEEIVDEGEFSGENEYFDYNAPGIRIEGDSDVSMEGLEYKAETRTLTLTDYSGNNTIYIGKTDVYGYTEYKLVLKGENKIVPGNMAAGLVSYNNLEISGEGSLYISNANCAIYSDCDLRVENGTINIDDCKYGVAYNSAPSKNYYPYLFIGGGRLYIHTEQACIENRSLWITDNSRTEAVSDKSSAVHSPKAELDIYKGKLTAISNDASAAAIECKGVHFGGCELYASGAIGIKLTSEKSIIKKIFSGYENVLVQGKKYAITGPKGSEFKIDKADFNGDFIGGTAVASGVTATFTVPAKYGSSLLKLSDKGSITGSKVLHLGEGYLDDSVARNVIKGDIKIDWDKDGVVAPYSYAYDYDEETHTLTLSNAIVEGRIIIGETNSVYTILLDGCSEILDSQGTGTFIYARAKLAIKNDKNGKLIINKKGASSVPAVNVIGALELDDACLEITDVTEGTAIKAYSFDNNGGNIKIAGGNGIAVSEKACFNGGSVDITCTKKAVMGTAKFVSGEVKLYGAEAAGENMVFGVVTHYYIFKTGDSAEDAKTAGRYSGEKYVYYLFDDSCNEYGELEFPAEISKKGKGYNYDAKTHTLTLNNLKASSSIILPANYFDFDDEEFTIKLVGNNTINLNGSGYYGLLLNSKTKIEGTGSLTITGATEAISIKDRLTVKSGTIKISECGYGIKGGVYVQKNGTLNTNVYGNAILECSTFFEGGTANIKAGTVAFYGGDSKLKVYNSKVTISTENDIAVAVPFIVVGEKGKLIVDSEIVIINSESNENSGLYLDPGSSLYAKKGVRGYADDTLLKVDCGNADIECASGAAIKNMTVECPSVFYGPDRDHLSASGSRDSQYARINLGYYIDAKGKEQCAKLPTGINIKQTKKQVYTKQTKVAVGSVSFAAGTTVPFNTDEYLNVSVNTMVTNSIFKEVEGLKVYIENGVIYMDTPSMEEFDRGNLTVEITVGFRAPEGFNCNGLDKKITVTVTPGVETIGLYGNENVEFISGKTATVNYRLSINGKDEPASSKKVKWEVFKCDSDYNLIPITSSDPEYKKVTVKNGKLTVAGNYKPAEKVTVLMVRATPADNSSDAFGYRMVGIYTEFEIPSALVLYKYDEASKKKIVTAVNNSSITLDEAQESNLMLVNRSDLKPGDILNSDDVVFVSSHTITSSGKIGYYSDYSQRLEVYFTGQITFKAVSTYGTSCSCKINVTKNPLTEKTHIGYIDSSDPRSFYGIEPNTTAEVDGAPDAGIYIYPDTDCDYLDEFSTLDANVKVDGLKKMRGATYKYNGMSVTMYYYVFTKEVATVTLSKGDITKVFTLKKTKFIDPKLKNGPAIKINKLSLNCNDYQKLTFTPLKMVEGAKKVYVSTASRAIDDDRLAEYLVSCGGPIKLDEKGCFDLWIPSSYYFPVNNKVTVTYVDENDKPVCKPVAVTFKFEKMKEDVDFGNSCTIDSSKKDYTVIQSKQSNVRTVESVRLVNVNNNGKINDFTRYFDMEFNMDEYLVIILKEDLTKDEIEKLKKDKVNTECYLEIVVTYNSGNTVTLYKKMKVNVK